MRGRVPLKRPSTAEPNGDIRLRQRLRDATSAQHRALDQRPCLRVLLEPSVTIDDYANVLAMLLPWYRAFEPALIAALGDLAPADMQARLKTPLILRDLQALERIPEAACDSSLLPTLLCPEAALGAAYVSEGATLGGAVICRNLRAHLPESTPLHFYSAYGDARGAMWQNFIVHLENKMQEEAMLAHAMAGACATFASLDFWISGGAARYLQN
jgi:heme oxygenase (biliverdin-IX-beta and delta-forming)